MAINIAKILAKNFKTKKVLGFGPIMLVKVTPGVRGSVLSAGNNPVRTVYPCKGARATKREGYWQFWQNAQTGTTARTVFPTFAILAATLPASVTPQPGDEIIWKGQTFSIGADGVTTDQVDAIHTCVCRGPGG